MRIRQTFHLCQGREDKDVVEALGENKTARQQEINVKNRWRTIQRKFNPTNVFLSQDWKHLPALKLHRTKGGRSFHIKRSKVKAQIGMSTILQQAAEAHTNWTTWWWRGDKSSKVQMESHTRTVHGNTQVSQTCTWGETWVSRYSC